MTTVFVALGANLGNPFQQANLAIEAIKQIPNCQVTDVSPFYRSKPLGPQDQPDYLNAVIKLNTTLEPIELLHALQKIELELGRVRKDNRWGPRTLDLDILLFGSRQIDSPKLTIPHYDMKNREFVIYPLYDLQPDFVFPDQTKLASIIQTLNKNGLEYW